MGVGALALSLIPGVWPDLMRAIGELALSLWPAPAPHFWVPVTVTTSEPRSTLPGQAGRQDWSPSWGLSRPLSRCDPGSAQDVCPAARPCIPPSVSTPGTAGHNSCLWPPRFRVKYEAPQATDGLAGALDARQQSTGAVSREPGRRARDACPLPLLPPGRPPCAGH